MTELDIVRGTEENSFLLNIMPSIKLWMCDLPLTIHEKRLCPLKV